MLPQKCHKTATETPQLIINNCGDFVRFFVAFLWQIIINCGVFVAKQKNNYATIEYYYSIYKIIFFNNNIIAQFFWWICRFYMADLQTLCTTENAIVRACALVNMIKTTIDFLSINHYAIVYHQCMTALQCTATLSRFADCKSARKSRQ